MKAITIKQPWASLIAAGLKDIENRTWKTNFRGRVLIHAAKVSVKDGWSALNGMQIKKVSKHKYKLYGDNEDLPKGAIIGSVEIVDCVQNHPSPWAEKGVWNWVLANPILFPEPIPAKGKLSFWEYDKILEPVSDDDHKITFDPAAQEALPDHIKAKMKAARDKARLEAYHKQCPCWNSHNDSCYDDNCPCDRDCEYMKSFNLIKYEL